MEYTELQEFGKIMGPSMTTSYERLFLKLLRTLEEPLSRSRLIERS